MLHRDVVAGGGDVDGLWVVRRVQAQRVDSGVGAYGVDRPRRVALAAAPVPALGVWLTAGDVLERTVEHERRRLGHGLQLEGLGPDEPAVSISDDVAVSKGPDREHRLHEALAAIVAKLDERRLRALPALRGERDLLRQEDRVHLQAGQLVQPGRDLGREDIAALGRGRVQGHVQREQVAAADRVVRVVADQLGRQLGLGLAFAVEQQRHQRHRAVEEAVIRVGSDRHGEPRIGRGDIQRIAFGPHGGEGFEPWRYGDVRVAETEEGHGDGRPIRDRGEAARFERLANVTEQEVHRGLTVAPGQADRGSEGKRRAVELDELRRRHDRSSTGDDAKAEQGAGDG